MLSKALDPGLKAQAETHKIDVEAFCNLHEQDPLDALRAHLQTAMWLELSTLPPYLTALFSIKDNSNVESARIIRSVLMEEMLHLTLAGNVLTAVGGQPNLDDLTNLPNYPTYLPHSNDAFLIDLRKFSVAAIDTFMRIELPRKPNAMPKADNYNTIGQFYMGVQLLLGIALAKYGEERVFSGDPTHQVDEKYYYGGGGKALFVHDAASANQAIKEIVDQGEGTSNDNIWDGDYCKYGQEPEPAHYYRFYEILEKRKYTRPAGPECPVTKPGPPTGEQFIVDYNQVHNIATNAKAKDYQTDPKLLQLNNEFNQLYVGLLNQLQVAFSGQPEKLIPAVQQMYQMKYLAQQIVNIDHPTCAGEKAAPTFEKPINTQKDKTMTKPYEGGQLPSIPNNLNMPFVYSSMQVCTVYFLVPVANTKGLLDESKVKPAVFENEQALVSFNFQRYSADFSTGSSLTQEIEVNILVYPTAHESQIITMTPEQYIMGNDQTKLYGSMHLFVPCDSAIAIEAGKTLFGEPKFEAGFNISLPSLNPDNFNEPLQNIYTFKTGEKQATAENPNACSDTNFAFACTVNLDGLQPELSSIAPITNYGIIEDDKLIGTRWNQFQVMPTYFFTPGDGEERVQTTYGPSDFENISETLKKLIGDAPAYAAQTYQSPAVATESRAYYV